MQAVYYSKIMKLKKLYDKYERYVIPAALIFGFVTDMLMFRYINLYFYFSVLVSHLFFSLLSIVFINIYDSQRISGKFYEYARLVAPFILYYSFGALFSAFVVFYSHGGSILTSWPFIVLLVALMIGNEFFRKYYINPLFQISLYFFALFAFTNLAIAYFLNQIGSLYFITSGAISLLIIGIVVSFLYLKVPKIRALKKALTFAIGTIFFSMHFLYFAGFIPPVPLSLKSIGVYHHIERASQESYRVLGSDKSFWDKMFLPTFETYPENRSAYVFSSIYALKGMDLKILHEWRYLNESTNKWETFLETSYPMTGGRDEGYRGYSYILNIPPGKWRVNVKSDNGRIIGRTSFQVIEAEKAPDLRLYQR